MSKVEELIARRKAVVPNGVGIFNPATAISAKGATIMDADGKALIDFAGGISQAITQTKQYLKDHNKDLKIIVEARNLTEIEEILQNEGVYQILIDNFNYEDTKTAVAMINGKCLAESSGNINEKTIRNYAACGVDFISSGALTHSVYNMDLSLKAVL